MKRLLIRLGALALMFGAVGTVLAQTYKCTVVTVSSTTTPTALVSPGQKVAWSVWVESTSGAAIRAFPYAGATVPASAPTASTQEVPPSTGLNDSVECSYAHCQDAINEGWAAVAAGSGTPVPAVDVCTR